MELNIFDYEYNKKIFFIIPTISIRIDDWIYIGKNVAIDIYILGFHARWFFVKKNKEIEV